MTCKRPSEKELTIECSASDHSCIQDGENINRVFLVYKVPSGTTNLIGLKITRGNSVNGTGILIIESDVTITRCLISDNNALGIFSYGGGVRIEGG